MEGSNATGGGGKVVASATGGLDVAKEGGGGCHWRRGRPECGGAHLGHQTGGD
jgi:hypothetical protein